MINRTTEQQCIYFRRGRAQNMRTISPFRFGRGEDWGYFFQ